MTIQKRLSITTTLAIIVSFIVLITLVSISFRTFSTTHAKEKADLVTELIADGLTAHMINGIMESRGYYLKSIENVKNIDKLWITRAPSVIKQFGEGFNNETPRDDIDRLVLNEGKPYTIVIENLDSAKIRYTVPYKATSKGVVNCLNCHDAKDGETLGTISMMFDITSTRNKVILTILKIAGLSILLIILVVWIINKSFQPFANLFSSINNVMKHAKDGDYSKRVKISNNYKEGEIVANWINSFFDKLENTLQDIQKNVKDFFTTSYENDTADPLLNTKSVIREMANIYNFKKTIEFDENSIKIYERLSKLIKNNFNLDNFVFAQLDIQKDEIEVVYNPKNIPINIEKNCRALRTKQIVSSIQFPNICDTCNKDEHHLCISYSINEDYDLMIYFSVQNEESIKNIKNLLPSIENYIEAAKPEIVSKNLTKILRHASTVDNLSGLYNRKFLDEVIDTAIPQAIRSNIPYGILMIDIDFFKSVNDTYGHDVGDKVIKILGSTLKDSIRKGDIAFRYGGEEFLVLLHNCSQTSIEQIAQKIRQNFQKQVIEANDKESFTKTLSVGYSSFPDDSDSIWKCIKYADIALYVAKESGRNRVIRFKESMLEEGDLKNTYNPQKDNK